MKAIILCSGYATRLYPLTLEKPKSLLDVKGRPILDYIAKKIDEVDEVDSVYIITTDKFYMNFVYWYEQKKKNFKKQFKIINDNTTTNETRLGGIGDLSLVIEKENINDDILVVLGDNLFDFDLKKIVDAFNNTKKTTIGVIDVGDVNEAKKFGIVETKDSKIVSFEEKPQEPKATLASVGIYIYSKEDLKKIRDYMKTDKSKDGPGYLVKDFVSSQDVYAFTLDGRWFDIGSIETYNKVKEDW